MSRKPDPLIAGRDARDAARGAVTGHAERLRTSLAERGIGQRLADHAVSKASGFAREAAEIANENRGVVAATVGTLLLWLVRKPLIRVGETLMGRISAARRSKGMPTE